MLPEKPLLTGVQGQPFLGMHCTNETCNSPKSVFLDIFLHVEFMKDTKMTDSPPATPLTECAWFFSDTGAVTGAGCKG